MTRAWRWWVAFWSEREAPEVLALFRVLVGLVIASTFGDMLVQGVAVPLLAGTSHGGMAPDGAGPTWLAWVGGNTATTIPWLVGAAAGGGLLLSAGVGGRVLPLLLGQLCIALFAIHPGTGGGHDRLITNALWLMVLGPATATWSIDARWRTGAWSDPTPIPALARRLAVWQLVYMYTLTGLQKSGPAWSSSGGYRALYDTFLLPSWARYDLRGVVGHVEGLLQVSTAVAWWWESLWLALGAWLLLRHTSLAQTRWGERVQRLDRLVRLDVRVPFVVLGVITHGVLAVLMNLGPFSAITLAWYVTLWSADDARRWRAGWRGVWGGASGFP